MRIIDRSRWARTLRRIMLSATLPLFIFESPADSFLKIDDIEGESTVSGYTGWIEIDAFSAGLGTSLIDTTGSTRTRTAALPEAMVVDKRLDASSPYLFLAAAKQTLFNSVVLESRNEQINTLIRFELTNAGILSLDTNTESSENSWESPIRESLAFDFEEWAMHYQRQGFEQVAANWNFASGTGGLIGEDSPGVPQIDPLETLVSIPGAQYAVKLSLSDEDTSAEKLNITAESLDPDKVSVVGIEGSGADRLLTVQVSKLFSGSAAVGIWVSDGFQSRSRTLLLSIEGGETPYETYLLGAFGEALAENSELGSPIGDPDNDGLRTIAEFYLGTDPNRFTKSEEAIEVAQTLEDGVVKTQLRYYRRSDTEGLGGRILLSSNLQDWVELNSESDPALSESSAQTNGPYDQVTATLSLPLVEWEKSFLRLHIDQVF